MFDKRRKETEGKIKEKKDMIEKMKERDADIHDLK